MILLQVRSYTSGVYFGASCGVACDGWFAVGEGAFMGGEFETFDVRDGDFGGGMQDIEFERLGTSADFNVEGSLNKGKDHKVIYIYNMYIYKFNAEISHPVMYFRT